MKVILSSRAIKQLKGISRTAQVILTKKIRSFDVLLTGEEKLSGYQNIYRIRVGNYRLIYQRNRQQIYVVLIGHRREIYRMVQKLLG